MVFFLGFMLPSAAPRAPDGLDYDMHRNDEVILKESRGVSLSAVMRGTRLDRFLNEVRKRNIDTTYTKALIYSFLLENEGTQIYATFLQNSALRSYKRLHVLTVVKDLPFLYTAGFYGLLLVYVWNIVRWAVDRS
jgi:hypothetical protein